MPVVVGLIHGGKGAYGISFPDFPGCISDGASIGDTIQRGRETLAVHIEALIDEGCDLPAVRDLEIIKADPDFRDDIADAVAVAALDMDLPGKAVRLNISLEEGLLARIDRRARELGETRSGFLASAARAKLAS